MKNSILLFTPLLAAAAAALYADGVSAAPPVDMIGRPALVACPPATATANASSIQHFDKIIFKITGHLIAPASTTGAANAQGILDEFVKGVMDKPLDIKVVDNPKTIADLKGKVLSFVGADPKNPENWPLVEIIDVEYASVVCPKGG
jgi:hypothetical protein